MCDKNVPSHRWRYLKRIEILFDFEDLRMQQITNINIILTCDQNAPSHRWRY